MDVAHVLNVLRKRWLTVLVCAILGILGAQIATIMTPKTYSATARTYVSFAGERSAGGLSQDSGVQGRFADYTLLGTTPQVMQKVADSLGWNVSGRALASSIKVQQVPGTNSLTVTAFSNQPGAVANLANATAEQMGRAIEDLEKPPGSNKSLLSVTILDPAVAPSAPLSPDPQRNLMLGLLVGLVIGIATAFVRDALDTSIVSAADVERITDTAPLGHISFDADAKDQPLLESGKSSTRSEDLRRIRTNLQYVDVDHPPKVLAVTSALAEEGKTSTTINLGLTLAIGGARVAIVEADIRRPRMSKYLGVKRTPGLTNVLAGQIPWQRAMVPWRHLLHVLPEGHLAPNPTEMLGSGQMHRLLGDLRRSFDFVILDTPPLLPVTDAAVTGAQADGVLLVIRHGRATRDSVEGALAALDSVDARILGTIVTFTPASRLYKYSRYGKYGRYGYSSGYGGTSAPPDRGVIYSPEGPPR